MNSIRTTTHLFGGALFSAGLTHGDATESAEGGATTKRGRRRFAAALVATSSLVFASPALTDIIHVPNDFPTIQEAIDAAVHGDEVVVAAGEYVESIDFLGKTITLRSIHGATVTTIDGGGAERVVRCQSYEGPGAALQGFTITGGVDGLFVANSYLEVANCTFTGNSDDGMVSGSGLSIVINCLFAGNGGNGLFSYCAQSGVYINCTFAANEGHGAFIDASFICYGLDPIIWNCAFTDNGGNGLQASYHVGADPVNCTFAGNAGWGVAAADLFFIGVNCIVWGNGFGTFEFDNPAYTLMTYSDVEGGWPGEGNIDADPMFVDPENGDYRLSPGSPCIDAADNDAVPRDECDLDEDGDTGEGLPFDLDGNPRFVDDPDTKDTGNGAAPIVDIGPYEFQVVTCQWDLEGDDVVGTGDLIVLLGSWGDPYGTADLIELLGNWGPCPK